MTKGSRISRTAIVAALVLGAVLVPTAGANAASAFVSGTIGSTTPATANFATVRTHTNGGSIGLAATASQSCGTNITTYLRQSTSNVRFTDYNIVGQQTLYRQIGGASTTFPTVISFAITAQIGAGVCSGIPAAFSGTLTW